MKIFNIILLILVSSCIDLRKSAEEKHQAGIEFFLNTPFKELLEQIKDEKEKRPYGSIYLRNLPFYKDRYSEKDGIPNYSITIDKTEGVEIFTFDAMRSGVSITEGHELPEEHIKRFNSRIVKRWKRDPYFIFLFKFEVSDKN